jgi:predicted cupin superfamily sugar epimerase
MTKNELAGLIDRLGLKPHPEGGLFAETYRGARNASGRSHSTAIYFLLPRGEVSKLHRIGSDEVWHFYSGDPLEVIELDASASTGARITVLGTDLAAGQRPQYVVPAGTWFGARPTGDAYALVGCTVAPGFEFSEFEMGDRAALLAAFPAAAALIRTLT